MLTAASRTDLAASIAMLAVAELPTAAFLALIARKAREFETAMSESGHPSGDLAAERHSPGPAPHGPSQGRSTPLNRPIVTHLKPGQSGRRLDG